MKAIKKTSLLFAIPLLFLGCTESSHTNSSPMNDGEGEFAENSFSSSSQISNRADIDYDKELKFGDTTNIYIEHAPEADDSIACSKDAICLEQKQESINIFLGEFEPGTKISIAAAVNGMENDSLFVQSELNEVLQPMLPNCDSEKNCTYSDYMKSGTGANLKSNDFVVFTKGFYFIKLKADFSKKAHLRILAKDYKSYYKYIGDKDKIDFSLNDTIRGIVKLGESLDSISINFTSDMGKSIFFNADGERITDYKFIENNKIQEDSLIENSNEGFNYSNILLPQKTTQWKFVLKPQAIPDYQSGPFATFFAATRARTLSRGEYLANPDSISKIGETTTISREKQEDYEIRIDQYIWLDNCKKNDSLTITHSYKGYIDRQAEPFTKIEYTIVDKSNNTLKKLSDKDFGYKATSDGPVYLHFSLSNSRSGPDSRTLELKTLVEKP